MRSASESKPTRASVDTKREKKCLSAEGRLNNHRDIRKRGHRDAKVAQEKQEHGKLTETLTTP